MVLNLKVFNRPTQQVTENAGNSKAFALTRRFILTGDERCPIAGIWSRLDTSVPADSTDEPCLAKPAKGISPWRAIHLLFISLRYLPA
jgi:hypothetical protein